MTELSEPPYWRKGPRAPLGVGHRVPFIVTDNWPEQQLLEGEVKAYNPFVGVYTIRELRSRRLCCVHESRVFTEKYTALRELALLVQESQRVFAAPSLVETTDVSFTNRTNAIARAVQEVSV